MLLLMAALLVLTTLGCEPEPSPVEEKLAEQVRLELEEAPGLTVVVIPIGRYQADSLYKALVFANAHTAEFVPSHDGVEEIRHTVRTGARWRIILPTDPDWPEAIRRAAVQANVPAEN